MKKIIASITLVFVALLLVGCGNSTYEIKFNADGGTPTPEVQKIKKGDLVVVPAVEPTKEGFTFEFWMKDNQAYAFSTEVTGDFVLKASWKANDGNGDGNGDGDGDGDVVEALTHDLDFSTLAAAANYPTTETEFEISNKVNSEIVKMSRLNAQINQSEGNTEIGVVLGLRTKNSWSDASLKTVAPIIGLKQVEINYTVWGNGASRNLDYAEGVYIQASTNGTDWNDVHDLKDDFEDTNFFNATKLVDVPEGTQYVRILLKSAGSQTGTYQMRVIVQKLRFFS